MTDQPQSIGAAAPRQPGSQLRAQDVEVAHLAGPAVNIDDRWLRQRCAWCGHLLIDYDLELVAVPEGQDAAPAVWLVGAQVAVLHGMSWQVGQAGSQLVDQSCVWLVEW